MECLYIINIFLKCTHFYVFITFNNYFISFYHIIWFRYGHRHITHLITFDNEDGLMDWRLIWSNYIVLLKTRKWIQHVSLCFNIRKIMIWYSNEMFFQKIYNRMCCHIITNKMSIVLRKIYLIKHLVLTDIQ